MKTKGSDQATPESEQVRCVERKRGPNDPQGVFACWHKRWSPAWR